MVVLHSFPPQPHALRFVQSKRRTIGVRRVVQLLPLLLVVQPGFGILGADAVGPAVDFHLQNPQLDPQLDLFPAVIAADGRALI